MVKVLTIPDRWSAKDMPDLTGKRFLITGATSGIGLAAATELARRNAQVVITARSEEKAKAAIKKMTKPRIHLSAFASSLSKMRSKVASILSNRLSMSFLLT